MAATRFDPPTPPPDVDTTDGPSGPIPPGNRPGHKPKVDQDKPQGPPPTPKGSVPRTTRFSFRSDPVMSFASLPFGVRPGQPEVEVGEEELTIWFGPWTLRTPLANVVDATTTGPFAWWKVVGPPHLSFSDRGITFATATTGGVCIRFQEPVPAALPVGVLRHPGVTVTVADPDELVAEIEAAVRRDRHARQRR
jgi:hypothetical protein